MPKERVSPCCGQKIYGLDGKPGVFICALCESDISDQYWPEVELTPEKSEYLDVVLSLKHKLKK
jgi:hypothetical protein